MGKWISFFWQEFYRLWSTFDDTDRISFLEDALEDMLGNFIFEALLEEAAYGTCPVLWVETLACKHVNDALFYREMVPLFL